MAPRETPPSPNRSVETPREVRSQTQRELSALKGDLERGEKLAKTLAAKLRSSLAEKGLPFDAARFSDDLSSALSSVLRDPRIPDAAKSKFEADVLSRASVLSGLTAADIAELKRVRRTESLGTEADEPDSFYVGLALRTAVFSYVSEARSGLMAAYAEEKASV